MIAGGFTPGWDFATQLQVIVPSGRAARTQAVHRFQASKPDLMAGVDPFPDLRAFLEEVHAVGVDVCVCSSTRRELVLRWIQRHRLGEYFPVVEGWSREHDRRRRCKLCSTGRGFPPTVASWWVTPAATVSWRPRSACSSGVCCGQEPRTSRARGSRTHPTCGRSVRRSLSVTGWVSSKSPARLPCSTHLSTHQSRTAAPPDAAIERRHADGISTGTASPSAPTVPAVALAE